jgi:tetratricopeptide (TPR) repeat protein
MDVNYEALFERILQRVDKDSYLASIRPLDPEQRVALQEIEQARCDPSVPAPIVRALIERCHTEGRLDRPLYYSALHVLAASPKVGDYDEAARLAAAQEMASLQLGGSRQQANLASVERHRGVLAFLQCHYDVALDYFSRAFEREHNAMNLSNVLATLLRLGDEDEAVALLRQVRAALPAALVGELGRLIELDPDLALLRSEVLS